jgi:hypothetical protein
VYKALRYEPSSNTDKFRWNHADVLVDNAHGLLLRALDARNEWQDRYLKFHTFLSELEQFEVIDKIHRQETQAGFYEVDQTVAQSDADAVASSKSPLSQATFILEGLINNFGSQIETQSGAQQLLSWLSHVSGYSSEKAVDGHATWNGEDKTIVVHCKDAAATIAYFSLHNELSRFRAEHALRQADLTGLEHKAVGLNSRADWERKNASFRRARTDALRKIYERKRELLSRPGGGLDFAGQLESALTRCRRDFSDGLAHAAAAASGLRTIFGYPTELPKDVETAMRDRQEGVGKALDSAITWVRDAASWLTRFFQTDGQQSLVVSLRQILSLETWQAFLRTGDAQFELPEDLFPSQSHVRLRGVSLHTMGAKGVFGASLSAPPSSFYRMSDGKINSVDQRDIPPIRIGGVRDYESNRSPEIGGTAIAYNVSPIGIWSFSLSDISTSGRGLPDINDVIVEFALASKAAGA